MAASIAKQSLEAYEDIRCSLCGDAFAIVSFAVVGAVLCQDLTPRATPRQVVNWLGLVPGATAHPMATVPMPRFLQYGQVDGNDLHMVTMEELT